VTANPPQHQPPQPILVTGAAGRNGGTGRAVVQVLCDRGLPVRALVRQRDERAEALDSLGAQVVVGDFADYGSLLAALDGVTTAYFCYPVAAGLTEAAGLFAAAGRERGLRRVVDMSVGVAHPQSPSPHGRAQWIAEQTLDWAGFECIHVRVAAMFMENIAAFGPGIRSAGVLRHPFGDYAPVWIAAADAGAIAARFIVDPTLARDRVVYPTGDERHTFAEVADIIAAEVGRPVRCEDITPEEWRHDLNALAAVGRALDGRTVDHLVALASMRRNLPALPVSDDLQQLTGRAPTTLTAFIGAHRAVLTPDL
jgi:uncharacterized protein YbjT (DUF2867 family)